MMGFATGGYRGRGDEVMQVLYEHESQGVVGRTRPPRRPPTCPTLEALTLLEDGEIADDESAMAGSDNRLY